MSDVFKVGDIACLTKFNDTLARLNGEEVTVTAPLCVRPVLYMGKGIRMQLAYGIELKGLPVAVAPENLTRKPDGKDSRSNDVTRGIDGKTRGNDSNSRGIDVNKIRSIEVGSWDDCPWKPETEEV